MLKLYSIFHLNLMFSSLETEDNKTVIEKCYRPILNISDKGIPIGIEASALTLETITKLDPEWIEHLKDNIEKDLIEFIGSGYSQLIGPLVPNEVNNRNQLLGIESYQKILGRTPRIALINEMSFSKGIVDHYIKHGYEAIIMEWDNPRTSHPEWDEDYVYFPQKITGIQNKEIFLIWARSILFQQFQRYAHGQIGLDEYLQFMNNLVGTTRDGAIPLYSNDAEIFNFRPGRYKTEALIKTDEWRLIETLFKHYYDHPDYELVLPSNLLQLIDHPKASNLLQLESAEQPIPVKKQRKYNISRWALTGRDDININSRCNNIFKQMQEKNTAKPSDWKNLCWLWSSDFRTNITEKRWKQYIKSIKRFEDKWLPDSITEKEKVICKNKLTFDRVKTRRKDNYLVVEGVNIKAEFNLNRGLSLNSLIFKKYNDQPLIGSLRHGYFNDIDWGADYYSGHFVIQAPKQPQITDLEPVEPSIKKTSNGIELLAVIKTPVVQITKNWIIDDVYKTLSLSYDFNWLEQISGSVRMGHLTLIPEAFQKDSLEYRTHNGGLIEIHQVNSKNFDHSKPATFLVSASHGLGLTEGYIECGDSKQRLTVQLDSGRSNAIGFVTHNKVDDKFFYRLTFSTHELDETVTTDVRNVGSFGLKIGIFGPSNIVN